MKDSEMTAQPTGLSPALRAQGWRSSQAPKDRPVFLRSAACVSVGVWSDEWQGWVAHADGFNARDQNGDTIVISKPDYWCEIPDVESSLADDDDPYRAQCTDNGFLGDVLPSRLDGVTNKSPPEVS